MILFVSLGMNLGPILSLIPGEEGRKGIKGWPLFNF